MTFISRRPARWLTAALLSLTLSAAHAQAELTPAAPPAAKVDPQAQAALDQMTAAYKALKTYSATLAVSSAAGGHTQRQTVTLVFQRPGQARIVIADAAGTQEEIVSNGTSLFLSSPRDKQYLKQAVPPGAESLPAVLSQARGTLLPMLAGSPEFLSRLTAQPGVTVRLGTPGTIAGVPTDTVITTLPNPTAQVRFTFSVGAEDHLLRRLIETATMTRGAQAQTYTHTETVTAQTPDAPLTAAAFAFVPPPGAKLVTQAAQPPMYDPRLRVGARPFPITARDLTGRPLTLDQYRGKVVLLDFWATWCGPCVGEMPNVIAAYHKYHARGFDIVGISLDQDRSSLKSFIRQNKMPWQQVFDGKGWESRVPREYGVAAIPFGLLLGRDGRIIAVEARGPALTAAIQKALAQK